MGGVAARQKSNVLYGNVRGEYWVGEGVACWLDKGGICTRGMCSILIGALGSDRMYFTVGIFGNSVLVNFCIKERFGYVLDYIDSRSQEWRR